MSSTTRKQMLRMLALILITEGCAMILPVITAYRFHETQILVNTSIIAAVCIAAGLIMRKVIPQQPMTFKSRDGFMFVIVSMLTAIFVASLPYLTAGHGYGFVNSWFEAVSGWTTTNAYVISENELPMSLGMWKAVTCWMGGLVIIFLTISVFQKLGIGGQRSVTMEIPGTKMGNIAPKMRESAMLALKIYGILTAAEFILLIPTRMDPYYLILNPLSSISTSGLIAIESNYGMIHMEFYAKFIITLFSFLASVNFGLYFLIKKKKYKIALQNIEVRVFLCGILISAAAISISLLVNNHWNNIGKTVIDALAQTVSYASTSGFNVADVSRWPTFAKTLLMLLSLIGGCGFSTASGLKVQRAIVLYFLIIRGIYIRIHPRSVKPIVLQKKTVSADRASTITVYTLLFFAFYLLSVIIISLDDLSVETTLCAPWAAITNTGACFGGLENGNYGIFSLPGRFFLSIVMIAGRLDIYAVIVLFSRSFWNTDRVTD
jgi:trk system potassium uptake protein TrkH